MRLIDADELLKKHTCAVYGAYDDSVMVTAVFTPYIKGAPTIDAVPVVRCGECRFVDRRDCPMFNSPGRVSSSDFCSYGERRVL